MGKWERAILFPYSWLEGLRVGRRQIPIEFSGGAHVKKILPAAVRATHISKVVKRITPRLRLVPSKGHINTRLSTVAYCVCTDKKASIRWQDSAPQISGYWPTSEPNAG